MPAMRVGNGLRKFQFSELSPAFAVILFDESCVVNVRSTVPVASRNSTLSALALSGAAASR